MIVGRVAGHTATSLLNGQVLIAGGADLSTFSKVLASAELYDPTAGIFSATASMTAARNIPTATLLPKREGSHRWRR